MAIGIVERHVEFTDLHLRQVLDWSGSLAGDGEFE